MNKTIEVEKIYTRSLVQQNPNKLFVFGDNEVHKNTYVIGGGQAVIRGIRNTFGICTLESIGIYWNDKNYVNNIAKISDDIKELLYKSENYDTIVFPYYGLGTGRASMQSNCPRTFLYLCNILLETFNYNNLENLEPKQF